MTFKIELVLFEPGDVEFLAGGTALELAGNVFLVVADDSVALLASFFLPCINGVAYFVMIPVVLTPSVLCVTRNLPASLSGLYKSSPSSLP